jgi:hypothetical protein
METVSPFALTGAIASMLTNLIPPWLVDQDGTLNAAFRSAGMELTVNTYNTREEVIALLNDPDVQKCLVMFPGRNLDLYKHHRDQQIQLMGGLRIATGLSREHWGLWRIDAVGRKETVPHSYH